MKPRNRREGGRRGKRKERTRKQAKERKRLRERGRRAKGREREEEEEGRLEERELTQALHSCQLRVVTFSVPITGKQKLWRIIKTFCQS